MYLAAAAPLTNTVGAFCLVIDIAVIIFMLAMTVSRTRRHFVGYRMPPPLPPLSLHMPCLCVKEPAGMQLSPDGSRCICVGQLQAKLA